MNYCKGGSLLISAALFSLISVNGVIIAKTCFPNFDDFTRSVGVHLRLIAIVCSESSVILEARSFFNELTSSSVPNCFSEGIGIQSEFCSDPEAQHCSLLDSQCPVFGKDRLFFWNVLC